MATNKFRQRQYDHDSITERFRHEKFALAIPRMDCDREMDFESHKHGNE